MRFLKRMPDGGPERSVTGFWLIECKSLFSICILRFNGPSRDAYHSHAFNAISWLLRGCLFELLLDSGFRGPWSDTWREYSNGTFKTLMEGRREVQ